MTRSSRRLRRLAALLMTMSVLAAACGGDDDDDAGETGPSDTAETADAGETVDEIAADQQMVDPSEEEGEPVAGGTLVMGVESEVDGLNPTNNALDGAGRQMAITVFDTLAVYDENDQPIPFLAESFTPSGDLTEWTITLRDGITFHDGTPFDAAAVATAFRATLASPFLSLTLGVILDRENPATVEVIDDATVLVRTRVPTAHFPRVLTTQLGMIPSPTWLAAIAENQDLAQQPVGTGPFEYESRVQDDKTVVVRNDDWWGNEHFGTETYLDAIEFHPVPNTDTRTTSLTTGSFDASHTTVASSIQRVLDEEEAGNLRNLVDDTGEETMVMIATDPTASDAAEPRPNPFQFIEARRALTLATPRQRYVTLIGLDELTEATHMFHPSQSWYVEGIEQEGDDPDAARAIVEEFCADPSTADFCTDGKIDMQYKYVGGSQVQDDIADLLTGAWSDAGFNVNITNAKQDTYISEIALGRFQVLLWRQFGQIDPGNESVFLACDSIDVLSTNFPRLCDPERDAALQAQRESADDAEREEAWADIVRTMNEAYTYVFLTHTKWVNSYDTSVKGLCSAPATAEGDLQRCTINGQTPLHTVWIDPG